MYRSTIRGRVGPHGRLAPLTNQLAISIAALALNAYRIGRTVSPNELRAVYVRASDAEINVKCTK